MDSRLEKALEFSNLRMTQSIERRRLKEKLKTDLTYAHNGGIFVIDRTLLTFLQSLQTKIGHGSSVILDDKLNPVEIKNVSEFADAVWETYFTTTSQYLWDLNNLKQRRKVQDIVEL
jgi:hypothetical protein